MSFGKDAYDRIQPQMLQSGNTCGQMPQQPSEIQLELRMLSTQLDRLQAVEQRLYERMADVLDQQEQNKSTAVPTPMATSPLGRQLQELNSQLAQRIDFLHTICEGVRL